MPKIDHKPYAGRQPAKEVQGIAGLRTIPCAFCDRQFRTQDAAATHERRKHHKRLTGKLVAGPLIPALSELEVKLALTRVRGLGDWTPNIEEARKRATAWRAFIKERYYATKDHE